MVTGPNGKSIFLPAAGAHYARSTLSSSEFDYKGIRGHYWSSSLYSDSYSYHAQPLYFWDNAFLLVAVIFVVVAIPFVLLQGYKDLNISGYLR